MNRHISKLIIGNEPEEEMVSTHTLKSHYKVLSHVWKGTDYNDFGLERLFRLFLISSKFIFPGLYLEHFFGLKSITAKKVVGEIYVLFKTFFPFFILYYDFADNLVFAFLNIYFLLETFIIIFSRIYLSDHFPGSYKRMILLLFFNFMEVVFSFAVIYSSGNYLNRPFQDHVDAMYFSMMTSATIGYGDIHPINSTGKLIAMAQAMSTLSFLLLFFNFFNSDSKTDQK